MADETIDDVIIGIKLVPDKDAEKYAEDSLTSFRRRAMRTLAPITSALTAKALVNMTTDIINATQETIYLSKQLDVSANKLYALDKAGGTFGTSFSSTLTNLQAQFAGLGMEDLSSKIGNLSKYGIDPTPLLEKADQPLELFREISMQWPELSKEQKTMASGELGFDQGMQNILNNMDRFNEILGLVRETTSSDFEQSEKAKLALDKLNISIGNLADLTARRLTPAINAISEFIEKIELSQTDTRKIPEVSKEKKEEFYKLSTEEREIELKKMSDFSNSIAQYFPSQSKKIMENEANFYELVKIDRELKEDPMYKNDSIEKSKYEELLKIYNTNDIVKNDYFNYPEMTNSSLGVSSLQENNFIPKSADNSSIPSVKIDSQINTYQIIGTTAEEVLTEIENKNREELEDIRAGN